MNCFYRFLHDSLWKSTSSFFFEKVPVNPFRDFSSLPSIFRIQTHKAVATAQQLTARVVAIQAGSDANHHLSSTGNTEALVPRVFCMMQGIQISGLNRRKTLFLLLGVDANKIQNSDCISAHLFVKYSQHHASMNQGEPGATQIQKRPQPSTTQYEVKSNFSISAPVGWT